MLLSRGDIQEQSCHCKKHAFKHSQKAKMERTSDRGPTVATSSLAKIAIHHCLTFMNIVHELTNLPLGRNEDQQTIPEEV